MIATINGSFVPLSSVDTVSRKAGPFGRLEESADTDKNAGQQTAGPYLGELRRNGLREEMEPREPRMAQDDPLGRGSLFDYVA